MLIPTVLFLIMISLPVPPDNQGMGNGNYHIAMHLFQYDEANHAIDAEIYDVISPNEL